MPPAVYGPAGRHACLRGVAELVVDLTRPQRGERCVDLCDATPALLAHLVRAAGPEGEVLAVTTRAGASAPVEDEVSIRRLAPPARPVARRADRLASLPPADVATSLLGLVTAPAPAGAVGGLLATIASNPRGRAAFAVWASESEVPHEAALQRGLVASTGRRSAAVDELLALGRPGVLEELAAEAGAGALRPHIRRVGDVARFDGVDHYLAVMVGERPEVLGGVELGAEGWRRLRRASAAALSPYTSADGSMRIPVTALVLVAGQPPTAAW